MAPVGVLDLPKDLDNPVATQDAIEWQRGIMERLEPGWPFPTLMFKATYLTEITSEKLGRLATKGNRSSVMRRAIARLLRNPGRISDPGPDAVKIGFKIDAVHNALIADLAKQQGVLEWWIIDHAVREFKVQPSERTI